MTEATKLTIKQIEETQKTSLTKGLSCHEAKARLAIWGENAISTKKDGSALTIAIRQFQSTVVILLLAAAAVSYWGGEHLQGSGIVIAVLINALVGFATEMKAKVSLEKLEAMAGPTARVIRDGLENDLPAKELVPGDLILLESGDRVPADLKIAEAASLSADESAMTGESVSVYKSEKEIEGGPDDDTMLFQGTLVLSGRARAIVTATGNNTRLGKLGKLLSEAVSGRTPLEESLEELGKQLTWLTVILSAIIALVGIWHKENLWLMLQTAVALAVAAIPEGMPVVATLALTAGTHRMVKARALIRHLAAVETLGCTTVICTDKTGTLTENQMVVTDILFAREHFFVTGKGYNPEGKFIDAESGNPAKETAIEELKILLRAAALCNDARLEKHEKEGAWHVHGDPTEGALLTAAAKLGLTAQADFCVWPRLQDLPFDLERKRMTTIHQGPQGERYAFIKGSPGSVLGIANRIEMDAIGGNTEPLDEEMRSFILQKNAEMAEKGLRVLAIGYKTISKNAPVSIEEVENEIVLLGLVGMQDRPREAVPDSIERCHNAGIKVVMLTGDQPATARAIAQDLKLIEKAEIPLEEDKRILRLSDLEHLDKDELTKALAQARVLARATPEMKLKVVQCLQEKGEVVAMTGDGVNDAPALRQANIGVAMGLTGTSLAREASAMVITDDNFATIVKAVEEGRIIYGNIRRAIAYLLTASLAAVICVALAVLFDTGLPFTPLQLLWLNLIMHIFPGLGIVVSRTRCDVMHLKPRHPKDKLIDKETAIEITLRAFIVAGAVLYCAHFQRDSHNLQTVAFSTLSLSLILQSISWMFKDSQLKWSNAEEVKRLAWPAVNIVASLILLAMAAYLEPLQDLLTMTKPTPIETLIVTGVSIASYTLTELFLTAFRLCCKGKN
ncbi:MAG: cation-transporting P-type ATPase [Candidatus Obscuribacterales bacterium]|nr:cation-transporting P-type ATPase [Candidatus Obscuribacterales bacterium]